MIEEHFENLINKMKYPKSTFNPLKSAVINHWERRKKEQISNAPQIQGQILSIKTKMKKIEEKILSIHHE